MRIQTAGEQKYFDIVQERVKTIRTGMIIWVSLLAVALIAGSSNLIIGGCAGFVGLFLAYTNVKAQIEMKKKLSHISDQTAFYNQLISPEAIEIPAFHMVITNEYVVSAKDDVFIFRKEELQAVEVGVQTSVYNPRKVLFVTGKDGQRHEVAAITKDSSLEHSFSQVYELLKKEV